MLGQHRQVIFKEDMYSVINIAHVNGERHRGYKGTFNKVNFLLDWVFPEKRNPTVEDIDF